MNILKLLVTLPQHAFAFSNVLIGLIGVGVLIAFHEFGHFIFAKVFNVHTPSFSIGFGPQLISKKIGKTNFSLSLFPLGGYVELAGHHEIGQGLQQEATRDDAQSFSSKPYWQKLCIMLGGILFNITFAYLAFFILFFTGLPKSKYMAPFNMTSTIADVDKQSPAYHSGLASGDTIIQINETSVEHNDIAPLIKAIRENPGKKLAVQTISSDKKKLKTLLLPIQEMQRHGTPLGVLEGVQFSTNKTAGLPLIASIKQGITATNLWILNTIKGFVQLFKSRDYGNIGGPLLIISESAKEGGKGWKNLLVFLAIISINLAILNLIPLPILDGGQILFQTLEALFGKAIPLKVREYIQIGSWLLIMGLIFYASYKDILKLFIQK